MSTKPVASKVSHSDIEIDFFDSFVFRAPVFPVSSLAKVETFLNGPLILSHLIRESLFLASPEFLSELNKSSPSSGSPIHKINLSLSKYLIRMAIRSTPFGLFAGCGVGHFGDGDIIRLLSEEKHKSFTRLDMHLVCNLIDKIASDRNIQMELRYFPNTTLYESGAYYRYIEYKYVNNQRKHFLTSLEKDVPLEFTLEKAKRGVSIAELVDGLSNEEISRDDAMMYIDNLLKNQVLISELQPSVIGKDSLQNLIDKLDGLRSANDIVESLKHVRSSLHAIDDLPLGRPIKKYEAIIDILRKMGIPVRERFAFQTDLYLKTEHATISRETGRELISAISVLNRLAPKYENPHLKKFKEEFHKRYENEEIPLVDALDVEIGIGFGDSNNFTGDKNVLLDGIIGVNHLNENVRNVMTSNAMEFLHRKYEAFLANKNIIEIEISEDELAKFPADWQDCPDTFSAMIKVMVNGKNDKRIAVQSVGGSTAANLIGRFCHVSNEINLLAKKIATKEQELKNGKIVAEIVHLPESRTGNVLHRSSFREFEIPYLSDHSVQKEFVLPVSDIMVSVVNGKKIVLRSAKHKKEIIPKLSTAHDFTVKGLPMYQFLCAMQMQGMKGYFGFKWGTLLENKPFLPRVRFKNFILSPATWNMSSEEMNRIPKVGDNNFYEEVERFRVSRGIPTKALLVEGDNKLLIEFDRPYSVQLLFQEVKGKGFRLEEFLQTSDNEFIKHGQEVFEHEVIVCFHKTNS